LHNSYLLSSLSEVSGTMLILISWEFSSVFYFRTCLTELRIPFQPSWYIVLTAAGAEQLNW